MFLYCRTSFKISLILLHKDTVHRKDREGERHRIREGERESKREREREGRGG